MAACQLRLLGRFALVDPDGEELALPTRKDRLLLAYLALSQGQVQDRGRLGGLLWGDRSEAQARDSLRQSIAGLKQAFREGGVDARQTDRDSVTLMPGVLEVDTDRFLALADSSPAAAIDTYCRRSAGGHGRLDAGIRCLADSGAPAAGCPRRTRAATPGGQQDIAQRANLRDRARAPHVGTGPDARASRTRESPRRSRA